MKAKTVQKSRAVKRPHSLTGIRPARKLPVIPRDAAGIDVGASEHSVCVPEDAVAGGASPVRQFGAFTADLDQLVEWLQVCGVKTAAMESTGVYWIPLYQKLEAAGLEVLARLGPAAANTATARKLATLVYHLLKYKEEYIDVDRLVYEEKFRRVRLARLRKQAEELGYQIVENRDAA